MKTMLLHAFPYLCAHKTTSSVQTLKHMQGNGGAIPDQLNRPEVRTFSTGMREIKPGTAFSSIWRALEQGHDIVLTHTYGFAMSFYTWLKKRVGATVPVHDYPSSRRHREWLHQYQSKIWIKVSAHQVMLKGAPENPWIREFYPATPDFFITFSDFLGLNGARQWYLRGKSFHVLNHLIHPFYGVYFPTRESHLVLFDRWLATQPGFTRAADIGAGCGILSFIMHKHGVKHIHSTDISPNAIFSIQEDLRRLHITSGQIIFPEQADMLGSFLPESRDLVVCNPPWIPGKPLTPLDYGSYYEEGFFDRLFGTQLTRCPEGVQIAILFSDFAQVAGISESHPIEEALQLHHSDFRLQLYDRALVQDKPSKRKSWIQKIRSKEHVELFILERKA